MTYFLGNNINELQDSRSWSARLGYTRTRHFKGTFDACYALAENTKNAKESGDATEKYFLEYNIGQPSEQGYCQMDLMYQIDILENWFLEGSDALQSVWLKADVVTFQNKLSESDLALLQEAFNGASEKHMSWDQLVAAYPSYFNSVYIMGSTTDEAIMQKALYSSLLKGNDSFFMSNIVLRRENVTSDISSVSDINLHCEWVNRTFTPLQLVTTWPSINFTIKTILPATGFWLYKTPSITQQSNNKLFISQNWEWAEAINTWLYKAAY